MDSFDEQKMKRFDATKNRKVLEKIRSNFILKTIFRNLKINKYLNIIKYNKKIQRRLNLSFIDYKEYTEIEIEIIPKENEYGKFINFKSFEEKYYHIYINYSEEETKKNYIDENERISYIIVKIDRQVKSLSKLFKECFVIESINFKRFYRSNILDMSYMFSGCTLLQELNIFNFNTENVNDMSYMFNECLSLDELNLSNFNTNNVINMSNMFNGCSSLVKLDLSNFNLIKVIDMSNMFYYCTSLKYVRFYSFYVNHNIINMNYMFGYCSSLIRIILYNYIFDSINLFIIENKKINLIP